MFTQTLHRTRNTSVCTVSSVSQQMQYSTSTKENFIAINGKQAIKMPVKGETVQFQNHHKQLQSPFVKYADFQAITEKVSGCATNYNDLFSEAQ